MVSIRAKRKDGNNPEKLSALNYRPQLQANDEKSMSLHPQSQRSNQ
jgi:hypothetical protein